MHINHRRTNHPPFYPRGFWSYSLKWNRQDSWSRRRARARDHIAHERFDALPGRYRRDIRNSRW